MLNVKVSKRIRKKQRTMIHRHISVDFKTASLWERLKVCMGVLSMQKEFTFVWEYPIYRKEKLNAN